MRSKQSGPPSPFAAADLQNEPLPQAIAKQRGLPSPFAASDQQDKELSAPPSQAGKRLREPLKQVNIQVPPRLPSRGPWRSGARSGDKQAPDAGLRAAYARHSSRSRSPEHQDLPALPVKQLVTDSGEVYLMTSNLAKGSQGQFRMCSKDGAFYAIKRYRLVDESGLMPRVRSFDAVVSEWKTAMEHGGIKVHDVIVQDGNKILVVTDLFDRDAAKARVAEKSLPGYGRGMMVQLFKHLKDLHEQNVLHDDVKPHNILLGEKGVKLADFGHAKKLGSNGKVYGETGTAGFVSKEAFLGQERDASSDVFSAFLTWTSLMGLHSPFEWVKGTTVNEIFSDYKAWIHGLTDENGRVDLSRIPTEPGHGKLDDFHRFGIEALRKDAPMLDFMLNGPAHPDPKKRSTAAQSLQELQPLFGAPEQAVFTDAVQELRGQASFELELKDSGNHVKYPLDVVKSDLLAFAKALKED